MSVHAWFKYWSCYLQWDFKLYIVTHCLPQPFIIPILYTRHVIFSIFLLLFSPVHPMYTQYLKQVCYEYIFQHRSTVLFHKTYKIKMLMPGLIFCKKKEKTLFLFNILCIFMFQKYHWKSLLKTLVLQNNKEHNIEKI